VEIDRINERKRRKKPKEKSFKADEGRGHSGIKQRVYGVLRLIWKSTENLINLRLRTFSTFFDIRS